MNACRRFATNLILVIQSLGLASQAIACRGFATESHDFGVAFPDSP